MQKGLGRCPRLFFYEVEGGLPRVTPIKDRCPHGENIEKNRAITEFISCVFSVKGNEKTKINDIYHLAKIL